MANTDPKLYVIANTSGTILQLEDPVGRLGVQESVTVYQSIYQLQALPGLMAAVGAGQAAISEKVFGDLPTETSKQITVRGVYPVGHEKAGQHAADVVFPIFGNAFGDSKIGLGVNGYDPDDAAHIHASHVNGYDGHLDAYPDHTEVELYGTNGSVSTLDSYNYGGGLTLSARMGFRWKWAGTVPNPQYPQTTMDVYDSYIVMPSPDGNMWKITVSNAGALVVEPLGDFDWWTAHSTPTL